MKTIMVLCIGIFCLICMKAFRKKIFSVSGIFISMWTICCGFSTLGLYEINRPSIQVVMLSCCAMIIFMFCSFLRYPTIKMKCIKKNYSFLKQKQNILGNKIIYILHILAYIYSFPYLIKVLNIMRNSGLAVVRNYAFEGSLEFASTATLTVFQSIIQPLFIATMIVTSLEISQKKFLNLHMIIMIIDVVLYTVLFAGRYMLLQLFVYLIFAVYDADYSKNIIDFIYKHKKVISFSCFLLVCLFLISINRSTSSFFKSFYVYFSGSFSYLSYLLNNKIGTNLYLMGRTQFGFIYNMLYMVLTYILGIPYYGSNYIITQLTQHMVSIGTHVSYNALGTMLHDFIVDYGSYGSQIGVFIYAYTCNYVEKMRYKKNTAFLRGLYYYVLFTIVNSVLGYSFRSPGTLMIIIFLYIFCKKSILSISSNAYKYDC